MTNWRTLPDERSRLYSPIGLLPRDDMTGRAPIGTLHASLDVQETGGRWRLTDLRAVVTQGGVIAYPGLGRLRQPNGLQAQRYRVRIEAEHYVPSYRRDLDGIEFDAFPYDDSNPPQAAPGMPNSLVLMPGPTYPFPGHVLVLRGVVVNALGTPVPDAEISIGITRRALSDARGVFALATAHPTLPTSIQIDATHLRSARVGSVSVQLPLGLVRNIQIAIS